jgi:GAF domain-containing protein/tetratricopeptide (TPR) repeat protein
LVEPIGQGSFAAVYRGEDTAGAAAAIKVLLPTWQDDALVGWRFQGEYRRLAKLAHPLFPAGFEAGYTATGLPYYAMALVTGVPAVGPLAATEVRRILIALAGGLAYMHSRGLVHGDIKPANVMLDLAGGVHLLDVGLTAPTGERRDEVAGTLEYLAPEVFRRQPVHPSSDLYALGALAFELWTGRPPFGGPPALLVRAHLQEAPANPTLRASDADTELAAVILALLAKSAAQRPASAMAVAARLNGATVVQGPTSGLLCGQFVGRDDLLAGWNALLTTGGSLELRGEVGMGKTRALDELRVIAEAAGWHWCGAPARGESDAPGAPLRAALGQAFAACSHAPSSTTHAWLRGTMASELADLEPMAQQAVVRVALAADLAAAAQTVIGLAIGLDDWHLADAGSSELLAAIMRATASASIAWMVASGNLEAGLSTKTAVLPPLTELETLALVTSRLGSQPPEGLIALLAPIARGNPGLTDLLLEHLVDTGTLKPTTSGWLLAPAQSAAPLPADGVALWTARLRRLTPPARQLASVAAVAWPAGALAAPLLGQAAGLDEAALAPAFDELSAAGIVLVHDGGAYRLAFVGLEPTLLADVTTAQRASWADVLVKAQLGPHPDMLRLPFMTLMGLARLGLAGSDDALAAGLAAEAGRRSLAQAAFPTARALLAAAEERLPQDAPAAARLRMILPRAEAERQLGLLDAAIASYQHSFTLMTPADAQESAVAHIGLAKCLQMRGDYVAALEHLDTVDAEASDVRQRARAVLASARIQTFQGRSEEALASGQRALTLAADIPAVRAQALNVVGTLLLHADLAAADRGMAMLQEALDIAEGLGDHMGAGYILDNVGNAHLATGALRDAAAAFKRSVTLYVDAGAQAEALAADLNLAIALGELGETSQAGALAADVVTRARVGGRKMLESAARGKPAEARAPLQEGLALAAQINNRYIELHLRQIALDAHLAAGQLAEAATELTRARELATASAQADLLVRLVCHEAELARQSGNLSEARRLVQSVLEAPQLWVQHRAHQIAAQLALTAKNAGDALPHITAARAIAAQWSAPWHQSFDSLLEARVLWLSGDGEGSRELAATLITADAEHANPYARAGAALILATTSDAAVRRLAVATAAEFCRATLAKLSVEEGHQLLAAHGLEGLTELADTAPNILAAAQATGAISPALWLRRLESLASATSEAEVGSRALVGAVELVEADRGYLLSYVNGRLYGAITHGMDYRASNEAFSHSLAEHALFTSEPLYLMDASADPTWREAASVAALGLRTVVCLPLALPNQILGVIYLDRAAIEPLLSPTDITMLHGLAASAAAAIDRERLRAAALADQSVAALCLKMAVSVAGDASREAVQAALLEAALVATGANRAFWLTPEQDGRFVTEAVRSRHDEALVGHEGAATVVRETSQDAENGAPSHGVIAWVVAHGESLQLLDPGSQAEWQQRDSIESLNLRTVWCLPIGTPDGALLYLDTTLPLDSPDEAGLRALERLVATAAALLLV